MNENFEEETLPPEEHVAEETPALKKKKAGSMPFQGYSKYVQDIDAIEEEVKLWLVTITDVVALMLTFFVLTYAMSRPEEDKWKQISASLSSEFTKSYGKPYFAGPLDAITIDKVDLAPGFQIEESRIAELLRGAGRHGRRRKNEKPVAQG